VAKTTTIATVTMIISTKLMPLGFASSCTFRSPRKG